MIIIAGWLQVAAEDRAAYLQDCTQAMTAAAAAPGCLEFVLSADPLRADRIRIFERWKTDEDLDRFRGSGLDDGPDDGLGSRILGAEVARYRISGVEDP